MSKDKKNHVKSHHVASKKIEDNKKSELEILKEQCEEYKAGWMRAQADYQNLQKEIENKRSQWVKMSELQILEEFIPVYSNFKKAFSNTNDANYANPKHWENWKQGIGYIMKQFGDILNQHNIEDIKTVGEEFNAELHEAVGEEESEDLEAGKIIREVEGGYKMGDKVIKCAKVIVSQQIKQNKQ